MLNVDIPEGFIVGPPPIPKPAPENEGRDWAPRPKRQENLMPLSPEELTTAFTLGQMARVNKIDAALFTQVLRPGDQNLEGTIQTISNLEVLQHGQQTEVFAWGGGINETTLRTIELGDQKMHVIAKAGRGESSFTIKNGTATRLFRQWNSRQGKMETLESVFDENGEPYPQSLEDAVKAILQLSAELRNDAAEFYGVRPEEVPINNQETSFRHGIEAGDLAFREVFAHRVSLLSGLNVVPETVLLPDHAANRDTGQITHRNIDVISAQRYVTPENRGVTKGEIKKKRDELFTLMASDLASYDVAIAEIRSVIDGTATEEADEKYLGWSQPNLTNLLVVIGEEDNSKFEESTVRQLKPEEAQEILAQGPKHKYAKAAMRIACLHYKIKALDGHFANIVVDTSSSGDGLTSIDNGLCGGLSRKSDKTNEAGDKEEPMDPYRSVMWEAAIKHPEWRLDEEALLSMSEESARLNELRPILDEILAGDFSDEEIINKIEDGIKGKDGGAEFKYLFELYAVMGKNKKIAARELLGYIKRTELLAKHGRPPSLPAPKDAMLPGNTLYRYEGVLQDFILTPDNKAKKSREVLSRFESAEGDDRAM